MSISEVIISIGIVISSLAGSIFYQKESVDIVRADIFVISPMPTPTSTPTLTPTPTPTFTPIPTPTNTPTPTPIPPVPTLIPYTSDDLERWFSQYSGEYGADRKLLKKIARCESGYNATSHNVAHDYGGMYQFVRGTWVSTRRAMGMDENPDLRFDAEEAIRTAAFKISRGGAGAWPSCSR